MDTCKRKSAEELVIKFGQGEGTQPASRSKDCMSCHGCTDSKRPLDCEQFEKLADIESKPARNLRNKKQKCIVETLDHTNKAKKNDHQEPATFKVKCSDGSAEGTMKTALPNDVKSKNFDDLFRKHHKKSNDKDNIELEDSHKKHLVI
eukprot:jgi/Bigna1/75864/fgenesh1_pg.37_\